MRRREFIVGLGGAGAWPLVVRAQQPAVPVIGHLYLGSPEGSANLLAAFRKGLNETGFVEGRNVTIEYRWGQNDVARLPDLAADLVRRRVAVIATLGSLPGALAAKAATATIPIVFSTGADPVQVGLVASLSRPGGNVTGIVSMNVQLGAKRLGLLHELLPGAVRFAVLVNPNSPNVEVVRRDARAAAAAIGRQIEVLTASSNREIDTAFASVARMRADALVVAPSPLFDNRRVQLITLAAHHRVPTIYSQRECPEAGGLMSYGSSITDEFRLVGVYTGRVLKGEKPADLPVMQPTTFEFVINTHHNS